MEVDEHGTPKAATGAAGRPWWHVSDSSWPDLEQRSLKRAERRITAPIGILCERCAIAVGPLARMRGLLGRNELAPGEGLLLPHESSVHMFFMRFPIDVVFLDRNLNVLKVVSNLRPWRLAGCRRAKAALELPAGAASGVVVGEQLDAEPPLTLGRRRRT